MEGREGKSDCTVCHPEHGGQGGEGTEGPAIIWTALDVPTRIFSSGAIRFHHPVVLLGGQRKRWVPGASTCSLMPTG